MKKLFLLLAVVLMACSGVYAKAYKGKCGKKVKWQYITDTRTLYIMGNGPMDDYGQYSAKEKKAPWDNFPELRKVIICDGVTAVGKNAFRRCANLERVSFPVEKRCYVDDYAFTECPKLDSVVIPSTITSLGTEAFYFCSHLSYLKLTEGLQNISGGCFTGTRIKEVYLPASLEIYTFPFEYCDSLSWIDVASDNPHYVSVEGRLYSKDTTYLYSVPNNELGRLQRLKAVQQRWLDVWARIIIQHLEEGEAPNEEMYRNYAQRKNNIDAYSNTERMFRDDGILVINGGPLRKIGPNAITGMKGVRHLILKEGIEELDGYAIGGGRDLISISFPSTLKTFGLHGSQALGAGCTRLQQVFIASREPEQLFKFMIRDYEDNSFYIRNCWTLLAPSYGEKDARIYCKWYVPEDVAYRYRQHPCWGQLKIEGESSFDKVQNIYWITDDKVKYIIERPKEDLDDPKKCKEIFQQKDKQ